MKLFYRHKLAIGITAAVIAVIGFAYFMLKPDIDELLAYLIHKDTHPLGFIILFILLPMVGFPIIPFLVLLGVKFGIAHGTLILFAGVLIHLVVSFLLTHSFLRPHIETYVKKNNISLPLIPAKKILWFSFLFMAIPGLSYAMKNYLLPLSGISFRYHIGIGSLTQGTMGIPFIVAGHAAVGKSFLFLAVILLFMSSLYIIRMWLKKKKPWVLPMNRNTL